MMYGERLPQAPREPSTRFREKSGLAAGPELCVSNDHLIYQLQPNRKRLDVRFGNRWTFSLGMTLPREKDERRGSLLLGAGMRGGRHLCQGQDERRGHRRQESGMREKTHCCQEQDERRESLPSGAGMRAGHCCQLPESEEVTSASGQLSVDIAAALHGNGWEGLTRCESTWAGDLDSSVSDVFTAETDRALSEAPNIPSQHLPAV